MSKSQDTVILKRTLVCMQCMKAIDISPSDIIRFSTSAWPECCGKTMKYDVPARPPITPFAFVTPLPVN